MVEKITKMKPAVKHSIGVIILFVILSALIILAMELIFGSAEAMHLQSHIELIEKPLGALATDKITIEYCGQTKTYSLAILKTELAKKEIDPCLALEYPKLLNQLGVTTLRNITGSNIQTKLNTLLK